MRAKDSDDAGIKSIFATTHAMLFFGTPHRGLFIEDVISMVDEESQPNRKRLVEEIERECGSITSDMERFINLAKDLKILSFYETLETPKVAKVRINAYPYMDKD